MEASLSKDYAIIADNLVKEFQRPLSFGALFRFRFKRDKTIAISHINERFESGWIHALVGPNGAGKTTFLKVVAGLYLPTKGKMIVLGHDTLKDPLYVRSLVGYCLTDNRSFFLRLSGYENLLFFSALYGLFGKNAKERIYELFSILELDSMMFKPVHSYSEGMKQRLALARALLHKPKILLLDEIGRGLDPRLREKTYRIIREDLVEKQGVTVLIASHNIDEVKAISQRVYIMDKGRFLASGCFSEVEDKIWQVFSCEEAK